MLGSDFTEPAWRQMRRWIGAAVLVAGVHAGAAALALTQWPEEEEVVEEQQGAIMFELSPLPISAVQTTPDVATPVDEVKPTEEKHEPVADAEIPKVEPSPLAPEPEVALPTPQPEKQPEADEKKDPDPEPDPKVEEADKKQDAVVPVTSEAPSNPAPPAPTNSARTQGTTALEASQEVSWQKRLVTHLGKHRRYPSTARSKRHQGDAQVEFTIDRQGRVVASTLVKSSGSALLDEEALAVLQRAAPFPLPPDEVAGEAFRMVIPIRFRIKD